MTNRSHYQFTVLPFRLSLFLVFMKCMVEVAAHQQESGIQVFPYLDDWLIRGWSEAQVLSSVSAMLSISDTLGLPVNQEKSILKPVQRIELIGAFLDSTKV